MTAYPLEGCELSRVCRMAHPCIFVVTHQPEKPGVRQFPVKRKLAKMFDGSGKFFDLNHRTLFFFMLTSVRDFGETTNDFSVFQLPSKDKVEVFGPQGPNQHFAQDSIVSGFLVDGIEQASQELVQAHHAIRRH